MKEFNPEDFRIFECITGSHLYGTNTPESDMDYRGVCLMPLEVLLNPFTPFEQKDSGFEEEDRAIYSLGKFLKLCADCNPNIVELLFIPEHKTILKTELWDKIIQNRHLFLSKKAKYTFTGYAFSQLNAIRNHRQWFISPPKEKPTRKEFGLSDSPLVTGDNLENSFNLPGEIFKPEYHAQLVKEREYRMAKKKWDNYVSWRDNRNPKRRELEDRFGYDCYVEDTEFLTDKGWKKYIEIAENDLLGTVNPKTHNIEFQKFIKRVSYTINDSIYKINTQCTRAYVTRNHNLFVSNMHRSLKNNFSRSYDEKNSEWNLSAAESLVSSNRSHYHVVNCPNNEQGEYPISDDDIKIMGLYVSEGCVINSDRGIKGLSFSQLESPNKIKDIIRGISGYDIKEYLFIRKERGELTYNIYNKMLAEKIKGWCGEMSDGKTLPSFVMKFSKRQANLLLDTMIAGDGTKKRHSRIYYTASKQLSDWTQIVGMMSGFTTKVWEYKNKTKGMYQVYISDFYGKYGNFNVSKNLKEVFYSGNVVCFEVPNSILITRNSGTLAFHGNTKHASHLFRLMTEGKELLLTGKITFPLPNAEEILAIKNGKYEYDEMLSMAETMEREFENWYNQSQLPKAPDRNSLTELYLSVIMK